MRTADPDQSVHDAIEAIRRGLDCHFSEVDQQRLKALRQRIADRIEFDLALLDVLDGDTDREDGADAEPSLGSLGGTGGTRGCNQLWWSRGGSDDREDGDDNGIGDTGGLAEQRGRFLRLVEGGAR